MSHLKRLLSDRPTSLERSLLEAAVKERPSEAQRMRVRRAMREASPVSMNTAAGGTMATKGIVAGIVGVGLVGIMLWQRARSPVQGIHDANATSFMMSAPAAQSPLVAPEPVNAEPVRADESVVRPDTRVVAVGVTKARGSEGARVAARAPAPANDTSDVRDQIRMIDEARSAMNQHNTSAALVSVDRYAAKYPEGIFQQEARILRILALDDRGDHARATALARSFLASYPTSAHVARIERIAKR
jgi:hypothetical protein